MRRLRLLSFLLALCWSCHASAGVIRGQILNKSTGQPGQAESVRLLDMAKELDQIGTILDADGSFEFRDVESRNEPPYLLQTQSGGVLYSQPVRLEGEELVVDIEVYDSSPALSAVSFSMHHLILERHEANLQVMEFLEVNNASDPPVAVWRDNGPLTVELPAQAVEPFEVSISTPAGTPLHQELLETDDANVYTIPYALKPGETRVVIRYQVPYTDAKLDFQTHVHHPVERRSLLVSPADIEVNGQGLTLSKEASPIPGYGVYIGTPLVAGDALDIEFSGGSEHAATKESDDPHAGLGDGGEDADIREIARRPHRLSAQRSRALLMGGLFGLLLLGLLSAGKSRRDALSADGLSEWEDRYVSGRIDRAEFERQVARSRGSGD